MMKITNNLNKRIQILIPDYDEIIRLNSGDSKISIKINPDEIIISDVHE